MVSCNNISESQKADIVLENIFARKSVRKFTSEPVSDKQVETLLKAAMAAPSAMNKQPWRFVVVNDKEKLASMAESLPYARLDTAPLAIVVCGDLSDYKKFWVDDCSAATENLLLAAEAMGLGAVWTAASDDERSAIVKNALELPENIHPLCIRNFGGEYRHNDYGADYSAGSVRISAAVYHHRRGAVDVFQTPIHPQPFHGDSRVWYSVLWDEHDERGDGAAAQRPVVPFADGRYGKPGDGHFGRRCVYGDYTILLGIGRDFAGIGGQRGGSCNGDALCGAVYRIGLQHRHLCYGAVGKHRRKYDGNTHQYDAPDYKGGRGVPVCNFDCAFAAAGDCGVVVAQ